MSKPNPLQTDEFLPREEAARLIRELAVKPPVKGMANVKAATDVFEANRPDADRQTDDANPDAPPPRRPVDADPHG